MDKTIKEAVLALADTNPELAAELAKEATALGKDPGMQRGAKQLYKRVRGSHKRKRSWGLF